MAQGLLPPGQPFCPSAQLRRLKVMDHRGSRNKDVVLLRAPPGGAARGGGRSGERNAGLRAAQGGSVNARRRCAASCYERCNGVSRASPNPRGPAGARAPLAAPAPPPQDATRRSSASSRASTALFLQPTRRTQSLAAAGPHLRSASTLDPGRGEDCTDSSCTRGCPGRTHR